MSNANIYKDIAERTGGDIYIGIVGPVRSGKSTFINCLTGIEKMDSGEIYFQNKKIYLSVDKIFFLV